MTGLDRAAKEAALEEDTRGERKPQERRKKGDGPGVPRGSVGLLLQQKAPEGPRNILRRTRMADSAPPGVDSSSSCQPDDRGRAASSSAAGAGGGKAATDEHEKQGAGLQIGNRRRGDEKSRDAISRSSGEFREEPIATEKGDVQRDPQRDPSPRRSPSRRSRGSPEDNRGGPAEQGSRKKRRLAKSMGSSTKPEGAGEERREEPYPSAESYERESLETVGVADDGETLLDAMKSWLRQEECGGLTVSQSGALMALATEVGHPWEGT